MLCGGACGYSDSVCAYVTVPIAAGVLDKKIDIEKQMPYNLLSDVSAWGYLVEAPALGVVDETLQDDGVGVHRGISFGVVSYTT